MVPVALSNSRPPAPVTRRARGAPVPHPPRRRVSQAEGPPAPATAGTDQAPADREFLTAADKLGQPLSPREHQVVELIAQGQSNREIAFALGISYLTVKEHVRGVYAKIGVSHRAAAVLWTVQHLNHHGNGADSKSLSENLSDVKSNVGASEF